jgi:hypothetical protein
MKRQILTPRAGPVRGQPTANTPTPVIAGKPKSPSALMLKRLKRHAEKRHRVFIQMRNGAGYCGRIDAFDDGGLSMHDTTIIGTKNTVTVPELIVHVLDGRQIAHIHSTNDIGATK